MKKLMLGNEAVARGLYESGCRLVSSYPGTPSTEMTEYAAKYDEIICEWAPNEKVAMEVASGAALGGGRSFCAMKHVGLNVAADPLFTMSYIGVNAGMVVAVADDPGMHSSQNEQDSRHYAVAAKLPMVEPSDSAECKEFIKEAFTLSETFCTPVLFRSSTRIAHSQSLVELCERENRELLPYEKNIQKNVMIPANAKGAHTRVEKRMLDLCEFAEKTGLNRIEWNDRKIGVITSGISYQYAKEALGERASYLKLGLVNPLPMKKIADFAAGVETLYVIEELDPVIEQQCRAAGIRLIGKEAFTLCGEYSESLVAKAVLSEECAVNPAIAGLPVRPPVMCPGCPHRGLFFVLHKLKLTVSGDIGCYTLGAQPPLSAIDTTICMGASISALHGLNQVRGEEQAARSVGVIGDSTFMHSGITSLVDIVYNKGISTVIILDNSITGMTGHQDNPTTGRTVKGDPTTAINLESLCRSIGINRVTVCDPGDLAKTEAVIREELSHKEPSVIITRRPCALLKNVKHQPPFHIDAQRCVGCKACLGVGCPAISLKNKKAAIDQTLCVGCSLCKQLCPTGAIKTAEEA